MAAKVGIIIPVYRVPKKYLENCVQSCINQTLKDIQIILVDDGSPDECGEICDRFKKIDNRIIVVHKENGGLSSARNEGVTACNAERLMFVDGDDWIEPNTCEEMYLCAQKYNSELVMCGMVRDYAHSSDVYKYYIKDNYLYAGDELKWLQEQLLHYDGNIGVPVTKLFERQFLLDNNLYHNEKMKQGAEGLEFNVRVFEKLKSAVFINKPLYHYLYNADSISSNFTKENIELVIRCYTLIKSTIEKSSNRERMDKWFDNRMLYIIVTLTISGFFNPSNKEPYKSVIKEFKEFLKLPVISNALKTDNLEGLSRQRKLVISLVKHRMYLPLYVLGRVRRYQKTHR